MTLIERLEAASGRITELERQLKVAREALPDDIDLFRVIRRAGRSDREKAQAVYASICQALANMEQADD